VTHDAFRASLMRYRVRPRLLVLNVCDSSPLAELLTPDIETVVAWPGAVDDKQARVFAHHLYRPLASGGLIHTAFGTARDTVQEKWPDLLPPELSGTASASLF
jgi:hypothetical protein